MFYLHTTPFWLKTLFPSGLQWKGPLHANELYLTFDDGPHPEVTPWVIDTLAAAGMQATFFCIGHNATAHPDIVAQLRAQGHSIGNHTHNHLNGWKTDATTYLANVATANEVLHSRLFRPPYGRITRRQAALIKAQGYQIVMWTGLTGDFDTDLLPEKCAAQSTRLCQPGNIIVLHDSQKAWPRLRAALPAMVQFMQQEGIASKALSQPA